MDFGSHTLHIFVSLIVVLACAGVALVCDLLKGNNEHLRELAVELKVRNEEAERRYKAMEKKAKRVPDLASAKPIVAAKPQVPPVTIEAPAAQVNAAPQPAIAREAAPKQRQPRPAARRRDLSPEVAAVAEAASRIANRERPKVEFTPPSEREVEEFAVPSPATVAEAEQEDTAAAQVSRKNWDHLLSKSAVATTQKGHVIPFESIRESLPMGFHDSGMLQRAVDSGKSITGLIVSIGTNELAGQTSSEVAGFVRSLLTPQDFGCQSGNQEFVLVCNGEQGASAQRRLSEISEKLWEFQLRAIGGPPIQFSWGSIEAKGDRLGEVVGSAIEQMQETRISRRGSIAKAV